MKLFSNTLSAVTELQDGHYFISDIKGELIMEYTAEEVLEWGGNPNSVSDIVEYVMDIDLLQYLPFGVSKVTDWDLKFMLRNNQVKLTPVRFESEYSERQDPGDFPIMDEWEEGEL